MTLLLPLLLIAMLALSPVVARAQQSGASDQDEPVEAEAGVSPDDALADDPHADGAAGPSGGAEGGG